MKRWVGWVLGAALVAAAWGVAAVTPGEDASEDPFRVTAEIGEVAVGRNLAINVLDVRRAERVLAGSWSADGNWVVVDLEAEAVESEFGTLLTLATLEIDGRIFSASERPESLVRASLSVGIPQTGSLAFELPENLDAARGILQFGLDADPRLDSVIALEIDLDAIAVEPAVDLLPTGWSTR
ncbi:hypothetical protein [Microbacterium sp.]|uniref:hypothetical protein n=1 Tax=Microbacterium sp. TaxID=51671 RepID=UPI002E365095|nr:hypothetical protein [Microbacterium sp.]HEX5729663.1 hypothetical protein [Microbacterium sp.]